MELNRNQFLKLVLMAAGGAAVSPSVAATSRATPDNPVTSKEEQFIGKLAEDLAAGYRSALLYVGDRLGVFKAMAGAGPVTPAQLADTTKLNARLLREWLNAMTTAEYVTYDPRTRTYELPAPHADPLAAEGTSALFLGGFLQMIVPLVAVAPKVAESFRTGRPLTMDDFSPEIVEAMERSSAPGFKFSLVQKWIAAMPDVEAKLRSGGATVDVGCGAGVASITLAQAFPRARCSGYDPHGPSIERARANARNAGVADRVEFVAADSSKLPAATFDFLTIFNSVHHFNDPVRVLAECRHGLTAAGVCLIVDGDLSPNVEENMHTSGRLSYAATTLYCLHDSMANDGAALGSEFGSSVLEGLAQKSGFSGFRKLPGGSTWETLYELRA